MTKGRLRTESQGRQPRLESVTVLVQDMLPEEPYERLQGPVHCKGHGVHGLTMPPERRLWRSLPAPTADSVNRGWCEGQSIALRVKPAI